MIRRFYKSVRCSDLADGPTGGFRVLLDGKTVKTPGGRVLEPPNRALAVAAALEWDAQGDVVHPSTMPVTTMLATALDREAMMRPIHTRSVMGALGTDLLLLLEDPDYDKPLHAAQVEAFGPLVRWFSREFFPMEMVVGFSPPAVPPEHLQRLKSHLDAQSFLSLSALEAITSTTKSVIGALAVQAGVTDAKGLLRAVEVDERSQTERWGVVEGGHDIDSANAHLQVAGAQLLLKSLK
jgi:ATP synthase F1 complex assembly factor 2